MTLCLRHAGAIGFGGWVDGVKGDDMFGGQCASCQYLWSQYLWGQYQWGQYQWGQYSGDQILGNRTLGNQRMDYSDLGGAY
jgi:hypothetical protein